MHIFFIGFLFLFFNNAYTMRESDHKNAMTLYEHISDVEFCNQAEEFLDSIGTPFEFIKPQDMFYAFTHTVPYSWKKSDLDCTENFLEQREKAVDAILKGDKRHSLKELEEIRRSIALGRALFTDNSLKTPTIHERLTMSYPVSVLTLFKRKSYHCKIPVPHAYDFIMTDAWLYTSKKFAKTALRVVKQIKFR